MNQTLVLIVLTCLMATAMSFSQTDTFSDLSPVIKSDKGHWLSLRVGATTGGTDIGNRWVVQGGYEGRFSKNWSIPIEAQLYHDIPTSGLLLSAALKARIPFNRTATNVYVQGGISTAVLYYSLHYALGFEYGLTDRLSLYAQIKKYSPNLEIHQAFVTIGININATSSRLRQEYELEK